MGDLTFSQMKIEERESVLDFLRVAYPDNTRQSDPQFWDWHYLSHPRTGPDNIPVWLAKSGGRIVGQAAARPCALTVNSEGLNAAWLLDLIVHPEFRRTGMGRELVSAVRSNFDVLLATPTARQHSPALFKSLGWSDLGAIPRAHRPLFPANDLPIAHMRPVRSAVNGIWRAVTSTRSGRTFSNVREVSTIDRSFDVLWAECRTQWKAAAERSSEELKWQYRDQPGKTFTVLGCYDDMKLIGYAVLFFRRTGKEGVVKKGAISDIVYHPSAPQSTIADLIAASTAEAVERRCGGLVADASDPRIRSVLLANGFWKVKSPQFLMASDCPRIPGGLPDISDWHITRADSDIGIFEDPNIDE